jgi:GH25 family lysozyme M1 (1,4-beta-N-acetylmuramidase)
MLIDISHYQSSIDWPTAIRDADGFYIKITEGSTSVDPAWSSHWDHAHVKQVGAYHFSDMGNPVTEANHFADIYLTRAWTLRPVLDIEDSSATAGWVRAFRDQFRKRTGTVAFRVYTSRYLLTTTLDPVNWIDGNTDIWAARYGSSLGWSHPQLVLWQNSSAANLPGFVGTVDTDQYVNGWTPTRDTAITPTVEDGIMTGIAIQTLPLAPNGDYIGYPIEVGSNSSVIGSQWVVLNATWGSVDYQLICIGASATLVAPSGGNGYPTAGTLKDRQRAVWALPDGCEGIAIHYTSQGNGRLGIAFPQRSK